MHKSHRVLWHVFGWQRHSKIYVAVNVRIDAGLGVSCFLSPRLVRCVVKKAFVALCTINHLQALHKFV